MWEVAITVPFTLLTFAFAWFAFKTPRAEFSFFFFLLALLNVVAVLNIVYLLSDASATASVTAVLLNFYIIGLNLFYMMFAISVIMVFFFIFKWLIGIAQEFSGRGSRKQEEEF